MRQRVDFIEGSRFWKLRATWFAAKARFGLVHDPAPPPIPPEDYVEAMAASDPYTRWLLEHEPRAADLERLREISELLPYRPTIAIVVDDCGADATQTIESAMAQIYPWANLLRTSEGPPSTDAASRLNAALELSRDDVVVFCDPDEILAPHALFEVAFALNKVPDAQVIYGDRDSVYPRGRRAAPLFAPDWSPEAFLSQMYTGRLLFYRRTAVAASGGFRPGYGTALHYDLALRVTESIERIVHCARILYHELRENEDAPAQPLARNDDTVRAVVSALERRGEPGRVEPIPGLEGAQIVRYVLQRPGRVEIVIATRDLAADLETCLASIYTRTTYRDFRITVVDNGSREDSTKRVLAFWKSCEPERFRVKRLDEPFNFSRCMNVGARSTDGPYVLLLNNDTEILVDDWLEAMLEQAQRQPIGAVGARLLYGDGTVQHAGVIIDANGLASHVHRFTLAEDPGPAGAIFTVRNYSAVTAACLMARREAFEAIDGFDEAFAVEYNDVDFCLRLLQAGYRNVYLPHVLLHHHESKSRGAADTAAKRARSADERALFKRRWWDSFRKGDPYHNPNLGAFVV